MENTRERTKNEVVSSSCKKFPLFHTEKKRDGKLFSTSFVEITGKKFSHLHEAPQKRGGIAGRGGEQKLLEMDDEVLLELSEPGGKIHRVCFEFGKV
jgi:hypothetical protein